MKISEVPNIGKVAELYKQIKATIPVVCKNATQRDFRRAATSEMRRIVHILTIITGEDSDTITNFLIQ